MAYKVSEIDMQFLANLVANPSSLSSLEYQVKTEDFEDPLYYEIYSAIVSYLIDNKHPNFADLKFKFQGDSLVIEIIDRLREYDLIVTDLNIIHKELRERAKQRKLVELNSFLTKELKNKRPSEQVIALIEEKLARVSMDADAQFMSVGDFDSEFIRTLDNRVDRWQNKNHISDVIDLPTGFEQLDLMTLGLPLKNNALIAASTNDGKTQLAVQISNAVASFGHGVLYCLAEDSKENILIRLASLNTGIPITNIHLGNLTRDQVILIKEWLQMFKEQNNFFIDENIIDINSTISNAKFMKLKYPHIKLVVYDNINVMRDFSNTFSNREQEISGMSKKILGTARTTDTCGLILQQLNTNPDNRSGGMPISNNDLRDSKAPSHDASVCLYLHFPDKHDEHKKFSRENGYIIIGKNRNGVPNKMIPIKNKAYINRFIEKEIRDV